jgi:hypothetical protein
MPAEEQKKEIEEAGETPIFSYNQTDFVKDRVAVEVQFGKHSFVAYDLFVKHLAFYVGDRIDVGIEMLPMKSLQSQMSSGVALTTRENFIMLSDKEGVFQPFRSSSLGFHPDRKSRRTRHCTERGDMAGYFRFPQRSCSLARRRLPVGPRQVGTVFGV